MSFFGIGPTELVFILVIALLLLGPGKMVETARSLGKYVRDLQRFTSEVPRLLSLDDNPPPTPPQRQQVSEQPPKEPPNPTSQGPVARE
ncbi:MAG: twin-arginine translocase TatA/TatE family subunit [Dehalococcoidia bacterium]|nr:twin-arginine translocase TatA/TatE family subunit [Dehalococcoidia bacterium]